MTILTVACPAALRNIGDNLAYTLGQQRERGRDAWRDAFAPTRVDAKGNTWHVMSMPVSPAFVEATAPAMAANPALVVWTGDGDVPTALDHPDRLIAVVGMDGADAVAAIGLRPVEEEI